MKSVLNFPNCEYFLFVNWKEIFGELDHIITYSKSYFILKTCVLVEVVNYSIYNINNVNTLNSATL